MDKEQEYYYNSGYVTIWAEVEGKPDTVIVAEAGNYGDLHVADRKNLVKKEDSYQFKRAQERADELRLITQKAEENFDKLKDKLVDKALLALASRMKFNALFGAGGNVAWAGLVIEELEKLVKEKAEETIKDKKDPF